MPLGTTSKPVKQAEQRKHIRRLVGGMGLKCLRRLEVGVGLRMRKDRRKIDGELLHLEMERWKEEAFSN